MTDWPALSLDELTAATRPICYGVLKPGPYDAQGVPLVRIQDLDNGTVRRDGLHYISRTLDAEFARSRLRGGEVLLSIQGTVGRTAVCPEWLSGANISRTIAVIEPDRRVTPTYLRYYFEYLTAAGRYDTTGSTRASLNIGTIRAMRVPTPPLDEQRRIVDILEDHLSRLDAATASLQRAMDLSDRLASSAIAADLSLSGAPERAVADIIAQPLANGRSVATAEEGFPVLRLTSIRRGSIDLTARKVGAWSSAEAAPYLVSSGDFLVARGNGSLSLVARGGIVGGVEEPVAFPDTMIRIRPNHTVVRADYLALVWNSRVVRRQVESMARTTAGIFKVNQGQLRRVMLPVPTLATQSDVVRRTTAVADSADVLGESLGVLRARSTSLRRGLLAAAFSGKMTGRSSDLDRAEELAFS